MSQVRTQARQWLVQALYQWIITGLAPAQIERQFLDGDLQDRADAVDRHYFSTLLHAIPQQFNTLRSHIEPALDRPLSQVDPVEQAVLLLATHELLERPSIPVRTVINEAINQTRALGAEQGYRFINGVLDRIARQLRSGEMTTQRGGETAKRQPSG